MPSGVRSRYHIAINGKGFLLRGAPGSPSYAKQDAPTQVAQLGTGDLSYNLLNGAGWSYFAQTDWSGGFQRLKFKDDGSFKDGQGIDVISEYGNVKLQYNFTSALSISGSHSYGASQIHNNEMILGSIKAGAAKVFKITSANVLSTLSAMTGISAVNSMSRFGDTTLIGMTRTSGTIKTLAKYTGGSTISGFRSTNPIVRAVKGIGIRAYIAEFIASLSGDRLSYATNLSAFTSAYNAGKNQKIRRIEDLNGVPYFFVEDGQKVQMFRWDELTERAFPIYTFSNLTNWGVTLYISLLIISGTSNNKRIAYAFNGARLWQIFDDQLKDSTYDFSKPFEYESNLHFRGAQWDGQFWFPGLYGKYATVQYNPFTNFNNRAYAYAVTGTTMKLAYYDTTKYQVSGNVVGSNFGSQIGAVDKLVNTATVNCKPLATGQTIEIFRSTDEGSNYTSIGTLSYATEGPLTNKTLYFPSGFVAKTWLYKAVLVGPGTSSPTLQDIAMQYRPVPDLKRRWNLGIDAGNDLVLLNQQKEQRDGKALMGELWLEKEAKRTVTFEDLDAFSAKIISAMTSANTSARVNNTRLMPPRGRIRVVKNGIIEEMTYTSADGGVVKGISRAQKGTRPRAYTSADVMDNNYTVLVTDIRETINNTDQDKTESIAAVTLLEV